MKKFSTFVVAVVAASAFAGSAGDVKKITATYAKMDACSVKKDVQGLRALLTGIATKDCAFVDHTGHKQSVDQVLNQMAMQMGAIDKFSKSTSHVDKTVEKGATITAIVSSAYALVTKAGPDVKTHKVEGTSISEDTWVKVGTEFKLKSSKTTKETTKMDGKAFPG